MLLIADWDEHASVPQVTGVDQPTDVLDASRFFEDIVAYVTDRSPIKEHVEVRRRRAPEPLGGLPDEEDPDDETDE